MKTIIIFLALLLSVSSVVNAGIKPDIRNFTLHPYMAEKRETALSSAKNTFKRLTNVHLGKNLRVGIITQGSNVKMMISKGIYPECYPAKFSMKIYYSF